jgi:hypothetical protein
LCRHGLEADKSGKVAGNFYGGVRGLGRQPAYALTQREDPQICGIGVQSPGEEIAAVSGGLLGRVGPNSVVE